MTKPWTFGHGGDLQQRLEWLTDILPAATGTEQRRKLRRAPRQTHSWDMLLSGRPRRHCEQLLWANGAQEWDVPMPMFGTTLGAALPIASATIPADTTGRCFLAGGRALLVGEDAAAYEIVTIDSVAVDSLALAAPTAGEWPAGTRLYPLRLGRLTSVPSTPRFTADDTPFRVEFQLTEPVDIAPALGGATYRGAPVFERRPVWSSDPESAASRQLDVQDEQSGIPAAVDLAGIAFPAQTMTFTAVGWPDVVALLGELYGLAGAWTGVWLPTWAADLQVVGVPASNQLDVAWAGLAEFPAGANRTDLRIELRDGTVLRRRITQAVDAGDVERVTLDAAHGSSFEAEDVALVSFLWHGRLEADTVLLRWWSADVVDVELSFKGFRHDVGAYTAVGPDVYIDDLLQPYVDELDDQYTEA
jgi:hypothetical protein